MREPIQPSLRLTETTNRQEPIMNRCHSSACYADGFSYPRCLCTESGAAEIAKADAEMWRIMFGPNGTQR